MIEIETDNENCLRQTYVGGGYVVSTIRLSEEVRAIDTTIGLMQSVIGDLGRADLGASGDYESMVFPGDETGIQSYTEIDFDRYATEPEALVGHDALIEKWAAMPAGISRDKKEDE